ncbi:hypothetical protein So717_19910 [Roseobacter cerasinus]|uniref:Tellurium resistance protein n=1 Tax=Roseobacter cerasinus TaxID=2602289 RepID=A0A640VP82_9RHOB|nr:TrgA family protein [Roseobacter cerasinus]GFE50238.1 hypothetical protein So717_19910 [Roseobacter cerasinus]
MPNAARLVAALCVGGLALIVSVQVMGLMPDSADFGYFTYVNGLIGLCVGWIVVGKRAGRGLAAAINNGLSGVLMLLLWALFVHACVEMVDRALANRYGDVFQAIVAVLKLMAEYGLVLLDTLAIATLIAGGLVSGLLTEYAWRSGR